MGMEIKKEIKPEGFCEDMKWGEDNHSELVKKYPDQWVDRGDYVEKCTNVGGENLSISFFVMNKPVEDDDNHKYLYKTFLKRNICCYR